MQKEAEDIKLDYLLEDFTNLLSSMEMGTERILGVVNSLHNFSRIDEVEKKQGDLHSRTAGKGQSFGLKSQFQGTTAESRVEALERRRVSPKPKSDNSILPKDHQKLG